MTPSDLKNCAAFIDRLVGITGPAVREIALLSPNWVQYRLVRDAYRSARLHILTIGDWDIDVPCAHGFDLVVAHNILHYMQDPARALANLMRSARHVWIQDLIDRNRGALGFAPDGDAMRYSFTPHFISGYGGAFDLATIAEHVSDFHEYLAEPAHGPAVARHFTAVLTSGSLAGQLRPMPYNHRRQLCRRAKIGLSHLWRPTVQGSGPANPSTPTRPVASVPGPAGGHDD